MIIHHEILEVISTKTLERDVAADVGERRRDKLRHQVKTPRSTRFPNGNPAQHGVSIVIYIFIVTHSVKLVLS